MPRFDPERYKLSAALRAFRGSLIMVLAAIVLVVLFTLATLRVQRISGTEVGVKVNNLTGEITVITESGTNIYNGLFNTFHLLDTTIQRSEMTADSDRGDQPVQDDLRIKTTDGSDVFLDLTINYSIRRDLVEEVITTSGLGDAYKLKWVRDYSRSVCRTVFGEMTTEEFYDAGIRNDKATKAERELNGLLRPFGIEINKVIAEKFRFHSEYEAKIKAKKNADQEVEKQISQAKAAEQKQIFRTVEATKKKEVSIATYDGQMRQLIVQANAEAERATKGAEAYSIKTRLGADAVFYEMKQNAKAILARKTAVAEGTRKMAEALVGEGGRNIVKLEYAKRLTDLVVSGQPFTIEGHAERFQHVEEGAASYPGGAQRKP